MVSSIWITILFGMAIFISLVQAYNTIDTFGIEYCEIFCHIFQSEYLRIFVNRTKM